MAEGREGDTLRVWVTFTAAHPAWIEVAEEFIRECPHVTRGTFGEE